MFEDIRNGTLAKLDYQQYLSLPTENIKTLLTFWCFRDLETHNIGLIRLPATLISSINSF